MRRWVLIYLAVYYLVLAWAFVTLRGAGILERLPGPRVAFAFGAAILLGLFLAVLFRPPRRRAGHDDLEPDSR